MLSLHRLPTRDECRPLLAEPHHAFVSHLSDSPRPPSGSSASVSSPRVCVELHAIGGFCAVAREPQPPPETQGVTRLTTAVAEGNGLNPSVDETFHCLAAEPHQTILRVVVEDEGRQVAYETVMLGSLRCGYRCLHLRSPSGTRIDSCCLLLHISVSTEPNTYGTVDELRVMMQSQRSLISQQGRDIHQLSAELSRLGSQPSTPIASAPAAGPHATRWPLELALDSGVNGARTGRPSPIALPPGATLTVGRHLSSGVALLPHKAQHISRQHAVLHVAADGRTVLLEDVSRKNGCRVQRPGGEPVVLQSTADEVASAQLREGSVLTFGQPGEDEHEFRYVIRSAGTEDSPASSSEPSSELSWRETPPAIEIAHFKSNPLAYSASSRHSRDSPRPSAPRDTAIPSWSLSPSNSKPSQHVRSARNWQSPLSSASGTQRGSEAHEPRRSAAAAAAPKAALAWTERLPAPKDSGGDSGDSENDSAPSPPPPWSLPPPSLPACSPSPSVPPQLRTRPPAMLTFYASAGVCPASEPQKRRIMHTKPLHRHRKVVGHSP